MEHSPIGKAVHDFGKSLRNTAIWLLIIDIILSIIIDHKNGGIVFDGRYRYDRFNADFYTTVSRGLAEVSAYLEGIFGAQVILANFSYFMPADSLNCCAIATASFSVASVIVTRFGFGSTAPAGGGWRKSAADGLRLRRYYR